MTGASHGTVLVTGAAGFLGAWSIAALRTRGFRPVGFDLQKDRRRLDLVAGAAGAEVPWIAGDIADSEAVERAVAEAEPASIVHLAAVTIPGCRADPVSATRINLMGQVNVLEAARRAGVGRVVYTSSAAAKPRGPEHMPASLYGIHKKACEEIARHYARDCGVASFGLRPFIVYGPGRESGETAAITEAMRAAAEGEAYDLPFAGPACFQFAGELGEIIARLAAAPFEGAAVADTSTRLEHTEDVIEAIKRVVPDAEIKASPNQRPAPEDAFDDAPLRRTIGDWPRVPLAEGTRRTIEAFRRQGADQRAAVERPTASISRKGGTDEADADLR